LGNKLLGNDGVPRNMRQYRVSRNPKIGRFNPFIGKSPPTGENSTTAAIYFATLHHQFFMVESKSEKKA